MKDRKLIDSFERVKLASKDLVGLRKLLCERKSFVDETNILLDKWLIKGSIVLNQFGGLEWFNGEGDYPEILNITEEPTRGCFIAAGSFSILPGDFDNTCKCCGKRLTIEDIYWHNYYRSEYSNKFYHEGDCRRFSERLDWGYYFSMDIISCLNKVFMPISDITVKLPDEKMLGVTVVCKTNVGVISVSASPYKNLIAKSIRKHNKDEIIYESNNFDICYMKILQSSLYDWKNQQEKIC